MLTEAVSVALLFGGIGAACVWLGRRGEAGTVNYNFGGHTVDNADPVAWRRAHQIAGSAIRRSGWLYVLGGLVGATLIMMTTTDLGAAVMIALVVVATGVMLVGVIRAAAYLNRSG